MNRMRIVAVIGAAALGSVALIASPAAADTEICEKYGSITVQDKYFISNNLWGAGTAQCIQASETGFKITKADHNNGTSGAPASYPSFVYGCHYANCTPGTILPAAASSAAVKNITTSASMTFPSGGTWDGSYDIWYDPTARKDGQVTGIEIMIWFDYQGSVQPIGSKVGTATIAGHTWDVWSGNASSWNVTSYVRQSRISTMSFKPDAFFQDAVTRGYAQSSWYMTSIQAGFEPWIGGTGLTMNSFSVSTDGSSSSSTTSSSSSTTTDLPFCASADSDPDGDGYGWENEASCVVEVTSSGNAPNGSPYCADSSSDDDGDGWGWQNNASCVVKGSAADS